MDKLNIEQKDFIKKEKLKVVDEFMGIPIVEKNNKKEFEKSIKLLNEIMDKGRDLDNESLSSDYVIKGDLVIEIHSFLGNNNLRTFD